VKNAPKQSDSQIQTNATLTLKATYWKVRKRF
jgi:hypothetical protein